MNDNSENSSEALDRRDVGVGAPKSRAGTVRSGEVEDVCGPLGPAQVRLGLAADTVDAVVDDKEMTGSRRETGKIL